MGRPKKTPSEAYDGTKLTKAQKERLNAFGERYDYFAWNGGYILYDKETRGKRSNYKFCGRFYLSSQSDCKYVFEDNYYDTPEQLLEAMDKYYSSLPFDAEIYNPINRKSYVVECATHDYLISLGFKYDNKSVRCDRYNFEDCFGQHVCTIEVRVDFDTSNGKIIRHILSSNDKSMWQEAEFTDLETAIGAINSLVSAYLGIVQAQLMNSLKKMTASRVSKVFTKTFDVKTLSTYTEDAKQQTIAYLESELKKLKEE